ncbi:hypothetical protein Ciccas_001424 [Cichlidogyrus casuarinus]|uniref:Uncharacterized protein n=1 Tax=Cichlidogyrus casuarinus TaxID=1844966 RepID=A0ABD2QK07_9PLAT
MVLNCTQSESKVYFYFFKFDQTSMELEQMKKDYEQVKKDRDSYRDTNLMLEYELESSRNPSFISQSHSDPNSSSSFTHDIQSKDQRIKELEKLLEEAQQENARLQQIVHELSSTN